jgi:hypothetical protein
MADITAVELATALEGFHLAVIPDTGPVVLCSGTIADADAMAEALHATLGRMAALREPCHADPDPRPPVILRIGDTELSAIGCILAALEDLDPDAIERVLAYVSHRLA